MEYGDINLNKNALFCFFTILPILFIPLYYEQRLMRRVQPLPHEAYHNPTANYYKKYNFYQSQYNISLKSIIHPFTLVMFILSTS